MDLLDEFKYQSYKSRIESLTGTKKPLVDLLKELTTKYATNSYSLDSEQNPFDFCEPFLNSRPSYLKDK